MFLLLITFLPEIEIPISKAQFMFNSSLPTCECSSLATAAECEVIISSYLVINYLMESFA